MTFLDVLLLSIVEGLTEFLPVSSTAHLYLFEGLLKIQRTPFLEVFTILIQVGALFGTLFYIYKKERKFLVSYKNIIFGVLPTLVIGFLLYKIIKKYFAFNFELIAWALLIGGVIMIIVESWYLKQKNYKQEVTLKNSFVLGVIQSLAVIPIRSSQVITGFSFSIGLPVVYFASIYDTYKTNIVFQSIEIFYLILGIILSGIFSYFSTKWIFKISKNISLKYFGIYRIILALIIFLVIFKI
jgi:undecaprenyl-diphosphatase